MATVVLIGGPRHGTELDVASISQEVIPQMYDAYWFSGTGSQPVTLANATRAICMHASIRGNDAKNEALAAYHAEHQDLFHLK